MDRRFLLRWLIIISVLGAATAAIAVFVVLPPSEPEESIRNQLLVGDHISESAKVSVERQVQLFAFLRAAD